MHGGVKISGKEKCLAGLHVIRKRWDADHRIFWDSIAHLTHSRMIPLHSSGGGGRVFVSTPPLHMHLLKDLVKQRTKGYG